jgi:thioesterase domain-containing protein
LISTQVIAQPDTTLGVARACRDASPEAAAVMIVALAAEEDINTFWPVLSQWEAWVKSIENQIRDGKFHAMRQLADAAWGLWQSRI